MGKPSEDCENDHDGKPGSSKLAMGLKIAAAGAELVENLGQLMVVPYNTPYCRAGKHECMIVRRLINIIAKVKQLLWNNLVSRPLHHKLLFRN